MSGKPRLVRLAAPAREALHQQVDGKCRCRGLECSHDITCGAPLDPGDGSQWHVLAWGPDGDPHGHGHTALCSDCATEWVNAGATPLAG